MGKKKRSEPPAKSCLLKSLSLSWEQEICRRSIEMKRDPWLFGSNGCEFGQRKV